MTMPKKLKSLDQKYIFKTLFHNMLEMTLLAFLTDLEIARCQLSEHVPICGFALS